MSVNTTMTALADEVREISGTLTHKSLATMTSDISAANTTIENQYTLMTQIETALAGKTAATSSYRGEWQAIQTYEQDDIVYFSGNMYKANSSSTHFPPTENTGMYWTKLTAISGAYRGEWEAGYTYYQTELVLRNGNIYQCINGSNTQDPKTSTMYWTKLNTSGDAVAVALAQGTYTNIRGNDMNSAYQLCPHRFELWEQVYGLYSTGSTQGSFVYMKLSGDGLNPSSAPWIQIELYSSTSGSALAVVDTSTEIIIQQPNQYISALSFQILQAQGWNQ